MADGGVAPAAGRWLEDGQRLFTVAEFYRMAEADMFGPDERVELLDGVICQMAPINPGHAEAVEELVDALRAALAGRARVRAQNPVRLDDRNDPKADVGRDGIVTPLASPDAGIPVSRFN